MTPTLDRLPASQDEIRALQSRRKRLAVERALRAPFFKDRLRHVNLDRLDDPAIWASIPILNKEELRRIPEQRFLSEFCIAPRAEIAEYWRSGGSTGRPLFYPRTFEDVRHALVAFARSYQIAGIAPGEKVHNSFPLGIHPAGQMWARAAGELKIGVTWAGAGNATPSEMQIELLQLLKPGAWMGMPSYGLHLLNTAESAGVALDECGPRVLMTSAEPLTDAKRKKLETGWGARVCDCFGMTEVCLLGAEDREHGGFRFFTDFAFPEVLDPESLEPVAEGEVGVLVVTPLFTNTATPFLRWNSGDLVVLREGATGAGPFDAFPLLQHARRTMGFFKIRGVNINHADFEEFMAGHAEIHDFRLEACNNGGLDTLRLLVEPAPGSNLDGLPARLAARVASRFEVACEVVPLPAGTLAAQQAHAVKPIRFEDRRETIAASPEPRAAIPPLS